MFVPIHHIHRSRGQSPQVKAKAVLGAVAGAIFTGVVSSLAHSRGTGAGSGHALALGLLVGLGAAALGLALARAIGRQGRI
jgi:hypothetical protein